MNKLFVRNSLIGIIFLGISLAITAVFAAAIGALLKLTIKSFDPILYLLIGGFLGLAYSLLLRKLFYRKNFFLPNEIDEQTQMRGFERINRKIRRFWIKRIKNKEFIKKRFVQLTYLPFIVLCIVAAVLAGVFYSKLSTLAEQYYIISSLICALIGSTAISSLMYAVLGLLSVSVCKKCGSVNAFVYDEYLDFEMASGFKGEVSGGGANHHGMSWGGWLPMHTCKIEKYGDVISRHCECCGEKSTYTTQWQDPKIIQSKNPTTG